jgi:hypothetical protein
VLVDVRHRTKFPAGEDRLLKICGAGVDDAPLAHHAGNQEVGRKLLSDVEPPASAVLMPSIILSVK